MGIPSGKDISNMPFKIIRIIKILKPTDAEINVYLKYICLIISFISLVQIPSLYYDISNYSFSLDNIILSINCRNFIAAVITMAKVIYLINPVVIYPEVAISTKLNTAITIKNERTELITDGTFLFDFK